MEYFRVRAYDQVLKKVSRWLKGVSKPIVLLGDIGVGKTRLAEEVAHELGYDLVVVDAYNYEDIDLEAIRNMGGFGFMGKTMILLDRPHEYMKPASIRKMFEKSGNPVLIEAEKKDYKYYSWGDVVWVDPPPKSWIAQQVRKTAIVRPRWDMVGTDVRQALLIAKGSMGYRPEKFLEEAEKLMRGQPASIEKSHLPILLPTILDHSYGYDALYNIKLLASADLLKRYDHLRRLRLTFRFRGLNLRFYDKLRTVRENGGSH